MTARSFNGFLFEVFYDAHTANFCKQPYLNHLSRLQEQSTAPSIAVSGPAVPTDASAVHNAQTRPKCVWLLLPLTRGRSS